ncbi:MAG: sigma-70 family RNA polymerase sigma factor [Coriobacteriales bacterium]|jgi:RNA polymerase sigma-70 factor (ECF subfamily)|nr:sigma-70 family RNA polymerase sigma factor [Coriobacteriales bacterium]
MTGRDEQRLLKALRRQEPCALQDAIAQYGGYVTAVAQRTLGRLSTQEDVEEVASDTFIALWGKAAELRPNSNLKAWLGVVARNTAIKHLRHIHPAQALQEDGLQPPLILQALLGTDGQDQDQEPAPCQDTSLVAEAIDGLRPQDRELLKRRYDEQQSIARIAHDTHMTEAAVKSRLYRSRMTLRRKLQEK